MEQCVFDSRGQPIKLTGNVYLDPIQGKHRSRIVLITIPRSGTHLCQEVLSMLGSHHLRIYLQEDHFGDYRNLSDQERIDRGNPHQVRTIPLKQSLKWIRSGQFVHTHLPYSPEIYQHLKEGQFNILIVHRNLRNVLISHARQKQRDHRIFSDDPVQLMKMYLRSPEAQDIAQNIKDLFPWFYQSELSIPIISYERLTGEKGPEAQKKELTKICLALNLEPNRINLRKVIDSCIGRTTFTYSGNPTQNWQLYWSPEVEDWFVQSGLQQINQGLGYESK